MEQEGMQVLVAEDDSIARMILEDRLTRWGYKVIAVEDGTQAMGILMEENSPRLAVLDWMMPGIDGLKICREVRKQIEKPYVYIVLITSKTQKKDLVEAMAAGADDFISKPPDKNELRMRLRAGKRIITLQNELTHQTTHDYLTGLWNRFAIMGMLEKEMNRVRRNKQPMSIALADIDTFKQINDSYGHQVGDAVICAVADRLSQSLRSYDAVCRYGGEEFLLIFPECNEKSAFKIAEKVRLSISERQVKTPKGELSVTISLGVTTSRPETERGIDDLIRIADEALYKAKAEGRNRVAAL